jgi:hypothetical protein
MPLSIFPDAQNHSFETVILRSKKMNTTYYKSIFLQQINREEEKKNDGVLLRLSMCTMFVMFCSIYKILLFLAHKYIIILGNIILSVNTQTIRVNDQVI